LKQMENKINYMIDEDGKKTHAVVPLHIWNKIKLDAYASMKSWNGSYPCTQVRKVLEFIKENQDLSSEQWQTAYEEFYAYYEKLDIEDILALYLFRSSLLACSFEDDIDEFAGEKPEGDSLYEDHFVLSRFNILTKDGGKLPRATYNLVRERISWLTDEEFLSMFKKYLSFDKESIKEYREQHKRIRKSAERDRMFIYDVHHLFGGNICDELNNEFDMLFGNGDRNQKDIIKEINIFLAKQLYNGNLSQVYRTAGEASQRVQMFT